MKVPRYYAYEFIGSYAKVIASKNKNDIGIEGKVIDETKELFLIKTKKGVKKLLKKNIKLEINISGKKYVIDCSKIRKRPEDRLKLI